MNDYYTPPTHRNAVTDTPVNQSLLAQLGYKFWVKRAPHVKFFTQSVTIPGFSLPPTHMATPLVRVPFWGEHADYEPLRATFVVDAEMLSYFELHYWLRGMAHPETFLEYRRFMDAPWGDDVDQLTSDIGVHVLSSTEEPKFEFVFRDAFPTSLSGMTFSSTNPDVTYVTVTAEFRYTLFDPIVLTSNWG